MYNKYFMKLFKEFKRACNHIRLFDLSLYFHAIHFLLLVPQINTVYDIITYHHQSCPPLSEYIEKQEKEIREGIINLNELKRFHKRQRGWYISFHEFCFECRKIINCLTFKDVNVHRK